MPPSPGHLTLDGPWAVLGLALATALATGLGALPFAVVRRLSVATAARCNALAAGLMLGASAGLLLEGVATTTGLATAAAGGRHAPGLWPTAIGATLGLAFIRVIERVLAGRAPDIADVRAERAAARADGRTGVRRIVLVMVVMTAHSFAEGVAVGVSFGDGLALGLAITIAIAVHNIPEGLAISAVLRPQGARVRACVGWSIFSSLPQPLAAVPAYLLVAHVAPALPYGLGFAAGAMVYVVTTELLPEAYEQISDAARAAPDTSGLDRRQIALLATGAFVAMLLFQQAL